jgi:hypothetical protein
MSASCISIHPRKPQSAKQPCTASASSENGVRQFQKARVPRVAPGKIIKAQAMLIEGYSQREIGRVLHLSPHTVAKVVKTEDFQNFIRSQREQLFGIASPALESLRALVATDGRLASILLKDLGVIPDREAMLNLAHVEPPPPSKEDRDARQINLIAAVIQQRYKVFGIELPNEMKAALETDEQSVESRSPSSPEKNDVQANVAGPIKSQCETDAFDSEKGEGKVD